MTYDLDRTIIELEAELQSALAEREAPLLK